MKKKNRVIPVIITAAAALVIVFSLQRIQEWHS